MVFEVTYFLEFDLNVVSFLLHYECFDKDVDDFSREAVLCIYVKSTEFVFFFVTIFFFISTLVNIVCANWGLHFSRGGGGSARVECNIRETLKSYKRSHLFL